MGDPCVYILLSLVDARYYVGSTDNLERRLAEHNSGRSKYTRLTNPFELKFFQQFDTLAEARRIEYRLKKLKRRDLIENIIRDGKIRFAQKKS